MAATVLNRSHSNRVGATANPDLHDGGAVPAPEAESPTPQPKGKRFVTPYSWWRNTQTSNYACIIEKNTVVGGGEIRTVSIALLAIGNSNPILMLIEDFWAKVDAGIYEEITFK